MQSGMSDPTTVVNNEHRLVERIESDINQGDISIIKYYASEHSDSEDFIGFPAIVTTIRTNDSDESIGSEEGAIGFPPHTHPAHTVR